METCWKREIWNGNSQKCKPSEMESLSQKVWNLMWKLWEWPPKKWKKNTSQKWKLSESPPAKWKHQLSDMETLTKFEIWGGNSQKLKFSKNEIWKGNSQSWTPSEKMHMFQNQYSFEMELLTLRNERLNTIPTQTFFFSGWSSWLSSHSPKPIQSPSGQNLAVRSFPPKKTLNQNCDLGAPLFEDVWTMFQWQNVEGFFQLFILKKWVHIDAEYMCQAAAMPPNHPQPIPSPKWERPLIFFPGVLQTSVFHFGVPICFTREKSCI